MKLIKFFSLLILITFSNSTLAQFLEPPIFCNINVDTNNYVHLFWYYPTSNIDGFIIKRIIWDGQNVIPGTLNNIDIINSNSNSYIDTSIAYETKAKPYERSETYAISAFKYINNQLIFSPQSILLNTIYLKAHIDSCRNMIFLNWTKIQNINVDYYEIFLGTNKCNLLSIASTTDTNFVIENLMPQKKYYILVKAKLLCSNICGCNISQSNIIEISINSSIKTQKYIAFASVENDSNMFFFKNIDGINNIYELKADDKLVLKTNLDSIIYKNIEKCFKVVSTNICNIINFSSANFCIIEPYYAESYNSYTIKWQSPYFRPKNYFIQFFDGSTWQDIDSTEKNYYEISLQKIYTFHPISKKSLKIRISYKIDHHEVKSKVIELPLKPLIFVPTAFNPFSQYPENRIFQIRIAYAIKAKVMIFTLEGNLIKIFDGLTESWDGTQKGQLLPPQPFIYKIELIDVNNRLYKYNGVFYLTY